MSAGSSFGNSTRISGNEGEFPRSGPESMERAEAGRRTKAETEAEEGAEAEAEEGAEEFVDDASKHGVLRKDDGVAIHYVADGPQTGQLVVLLHGFPSFWYTWKYQIGALAKHGYRVVAPDMRGYNLSSKPTSLKGYSRDAVLSDIAALVRHFSPTKHRATLLVGHDWGGSVAWAFAEDYPDMVARLAIINVPHPATFAHSLRTNVRQMRRSWYIFLFQVPRLGEVYMSANNFDTLKKIVRDDPVKKPSEEHVQRHVEAFSRPGALTGGINYYRAAPWYWGSKGPQSSTVSAAVASTLAPLLPSASPSARPQPSLSYSSPSSQPMSAWPSSMSPSSKSPSSSSPPPSSPSTLVSTTPPPPVSVTGGEGAGARARDQEPPRPRASAHPQIRMPVLVLWGDKDTFIEPSLAAPPVDLVPNCKFVRFPEASHWVMWDEPHQVSAHLLRFASSPLPPPSSTDESSWVRARL